MILIRGFSGEVCFWPVAVCQRQDQGMGKTGDEDARAGERMRSHLQILSSEITATNSESEKVKGRAGILTVQRK